MLSCKSSAKEKQLMKQILQFFSSTKITLKVTETFDANWVEQSRSPDA